MKRVVKVKLHSGFLGGDLYAGRVIRIRQLLICCLLLPLWCAAVRPYTPQIHDPLPEPWRWRHEELLNDLNVLCMAEAVDGMLWFGGIGHLASYDGSMVKEIPLDDSLLAKITHRKPVPWVNALLTLPDGNLLALIGESLVLRRDNGWQVIVQDVGESLFGVKLERSPDGTIWLLGPEALWRISADLSICTKIMTATGNHPLLSFCFDASGTLWVTQQTAWDQVALIRLSFAEGRSLPECKTIAAPFAYIQGSVDLAARWDGTLVIATGQQETPLYLFDPLSGAWTPKGEDKRMWPQKSLCAGKEGSVWIGLAGGLSRLTPNGELLEYPDIKFDFPTMTPKLFEASNDRLWIIGRGGKVCSVDLGFQEWLTYAGLNFECETKDGVQWFRTGEISQAIAHDMHSGQWLRYGLEDQLIDTVYLLFHSSHGLIWAVGRHEGRAAFSVFDGKKWTRFLFPEFAEIIRPNGVFEASDGTVWLGAQGRKLDFLPNAGGALQFKVTENRGVELVKHHSPADGFPYYVTAFAETTDGSIWLGSTVVRRVRKDGSIERFPDLQGENVVAMTIDQEGALWIAKEFFGVCRWKDEAWTVFALDEGLDDLKLNGIQTLSDGSLLVSGEKIKRFDGTSWVDGMDSKRFGMSSRWSTIKTSRKGELIWLNYIRFERKMSEIVPESKSICTIRHRMETEPPDTQIDRYLERVSPPGNTLISWSAHDPWSSTLREDLRYSWRLDGREWSPFSGETSQMLLNLSSGPHVLEVRARDRAFNVDPTPARVEFTVVAPVWRQPWFVMMVFLFSGAIAVLTWLLLRTRERHLQERQAEREAFLVKQQADREEYLLKQQDERERHLLEVDRIKTGFFTNISHELRTPMTVVAGRLEAFFHSEPDEKRRSSLLITLRNAQRVSTLITQLLDFRKIEEGKLKVEATQGDLVPPLREWVASLQVLAEQARITLSLNCAEEFRGEFDFDKLQKICTNLISNAIKYTKAGGEVRVCLNVVGRERSQTFPPSDADSAGRSATVPALQFTVEDDGIGIPEKHIKNIFDRFYRVSEASMAAGAGIGLNLTKELVDLMGGTIQVESPIHPDAERPGTRFTVLLPMDQKSEVGDQKSEVGDQRSEGRDQRSDDEESPLLLVVEDDEDVRDFIIEGLASGYRVETAENGETGLEMAKERVPDLIITDVMMPVMDGVTLCRELKTSMETSHIPVVMLTAKTALESQLEGLKTGADDYITKPFHMELLRVRIANLLESRRVLREQFLREYSVLSPKIPENPLHKEFLEKAIKVMEARYSDWTFGPDQFAAALNMSISTLQRKLKAATNRTRAEWITEFRMMKAAELLVGTAKTVVEISFDVGCDESSNFSRQFKKVYGKTPSQYRDAHRDALS
jgi:signal transduction histidine kinase/DNA-binding NarL/FixJ family response regulator/ligand-binding sensor domain-containing protein